MKNEHFDSKTPRATESFGLASLALLSAAILALMPANLAAQEAACLLEGTSAADTVVNPPRGGDNDFFSSSGGPPNLMFIVDTSCSMRRMPEVPTSDGCGEAAFNSLMNYDPSVTYGDYDPKSIPSAPISDGGWPSLYTKGDYYRCDSQCDENGLSLNDSDICDGDSTCQNCMATQGYFYEEDGGDSYFVADGNFLNLFPPKYVIARKVMKDVVKDTKSVRMAVLGFNGSEGAEWITNSKSMNPPCGLAWPPDGSSFYNNRSSIVSKVNALGHGDFDGSTPLAEALYDAGQWFNYGDDFYGVGSWSIDSTFSSPTGSAQQASICWECQQSNIVLMTDGNPSSSDNDDIDSDISNLPTPCPPINSGTCGVNLLHKVADMLQNNDVNLDVAGFQNVTTYTVAFALDDADADTLLSATADAGGGFYVKANNADALADGIRSVIDDVISRSISFTSSSFSGVQSSASQSILLPRLIPDKGKPWKGELYRFDFLSEFVADIDLDGDGEKTQFFLVDSDCSGVNWGAVSAPPASCKPIGSDQVLGLFWKKEGGSACSNPGWCSDSTTSVFPAIPHWEAGDRLLTMGSANRDIYTVIDNSGAPDGDIDANDPVIEFTEAASANLLPYLGLTTAFCTDIATRHSVTFADLDACAKGVIRYVRGRLMDDSGDRPYILSDIFHSSPEIVEPPTPFGLLNTPFRHPQSMITLGLDNDFQSDPSTSNAYGEFAQDHRARDRVAVVGSNGGMIHAFNVGECAPNCGTGTQTPKYDRGTGDELWAFVPPDMLAKLKYFALSQDHHLFVDGAPWIRNIWVDGLVSGADYERQKNEFVTIGIFNERRGGVHRTALDLTDLDDSSYVPKFLWTFPHIDAGNNASAGLELVNAGESWADTLPAPPPIGPIRYEDSSSPVDFNGTSYTERWITMIGGGYDPMNMKGRGWYMLDAYTGETLWNFTWDESDTVKANLHFSFAAAPALTAWGDSNTRTYNNPYFDTMLVGDTGGQLWSGRFADPDPANWAGARVFAENASTLSSNYVDRNPFFSIAWFSVLEESSMLRANIGTGNRHHLRDEGGGVCGFDNLHACVKMGCEVEVNNQGSDAKRGPEVGPYSYGHQHWGLSSAGAWINEHMRSGDFAVDSSKTACVDGTFQQAHIEIRDCPSKTGTVDFISDAAHDCSGGSCTTTFTDSSELGGIECQDQSAWPKNRFYSVRVFGGSRTPYNDATDAATFDGSVLTNGATAADVQDADTAAVGSLSPGWFYEYNELEERTASGAVGGGACIVWSSLQAAPPPSCSSSSSVGDACGGGGANVAYMYFRNNVSGKANCVNNTGTGWDAVEGRQHMGSDPKPPPPPQIIVQASSTGAVKSSVATAEGGGVDVGEGDTLFQSYTQMEIPSETHDIRHGAVAP